MNFRNMCYVLAMGMLCGLRGLAVVPKSATLEIKGDYQYIEGTVVFQSIQAAQIDPSLTNNGLFPYFDIKLVRLDSLPLDIAVTASTDTTHNHSFYKKLLDANSKISATDSTTYELTVHFQIYPTNSAKIKLSDPSILETDGSIKVQFIFNAKGKTPDTWSTDYFAKKLLGKPNEAPKDLTATSIYQGARAKWNSTVTSTYTQGAARVPSNIVLFAVQEDDDGAVFQGKLVTTDAQGVETETDSTACVFTNDDTCVNCQGQNIYLSENQTADPKIHVQSGTNNGDLAIRELEVGKSYRLFLQYQTGFKQTKCLQVTPKEDITLSELLGDQASKDDPRCFIATAAYGSPLAAELKVFRWFRSQVLFSLPGGRSLVRLYYAKSPVLADWISQSPSRQTAARVLLWPLFVLFSLMKAFFDQPLYGILLLMLGMLLVLRQKSLS